MTHSPCDSCVLICLEAAGNSTLDLRLYGDGGTTLSSGSPCSKALAPLTLNLLRNYILHG